MASDAEAILFNLSKGRHFSSKQTEKDVYCREDHGPCFGGQDDKELCAWVEPFNEDESCISIANGPAYGIPIDIDGLNMLTNKKDGKFSIAEIEIWEVTYIF